MSDLVKLRQAFQCCDEDFSDTVLKGNVGIVIISEQELLRVIKQLDIIPL